MNNFDVIVELIECLIDEEKDCKRGGGNQGCFDFGNVENPVAGKDVDAIEAAYRAQERKQANAEKAKKRKQKKDNEKAQQQFSHDNQLGLFSNKTQKEIEQENEENKDK